VSTAAPYTNRDLFSTHFLDDLLPVQPEWTGSREGRQRAFETLQALYSREAALLPTLKEKQLESRWVREVFRALGVVFEVGPRLPTDLPAVTLEPDYALFASEVDLRLAAEQRSAGNFEGYFQRARMVGDAKRWGTDFGSAARGQKTPRQQITQYIHLSGVAWGLLTDGRLWRLTHRSVAGRLDRYYEVDLAACLEAGDVERFGYFYLFFRGEALRPSALGGPCFLDQALRESSAYAEAVGRELKDAVYEALRLLARGFLSRVGTDGVAVAELRRECLTLLYRLLFLLYAEHRALLPLASSRYEAYSLTALAREIAAKLDTGVAYGARGTVLSGRLHALFEMVDQGDPDLGVPPYNGGLFSETEHHFLSAQGPADRELAQAIDLLARAGPAPRHSIDYRDLDIQHLGTVYEGLLEYRLEIASQDLVAVPATKGQAETYEPFNSKRHAAVSADRRIPQGEPYLVTDRGERRVTGSFYTPDFVVEHIVEETLGPLVAGRSPEQVLALRVVDPAMGSGHFLLEAVDFLARAYG
jgi:hypothetical protein